MRLLKFTKRKKILKISTNDTWDNKDALIINMQQSKLLYTTHSSSI